MKKATLSFLALALAAGQALALVASDVASNPAYSGGWSNGTNGGTGFNPWSIVSNPGTGGFAGSELKNPVNVSISGMGTIAFTPFADPSGSGAYVDANRSFSTALSVGDTFTVQLGINWDSGSTGNKGFNLYTGGTSGTQLININNAGTAIITINGNTMFSNYGTQAMNLSFQLTSATNLLVSGTGRDGIEAYSNNFTIAAAPDAFRLYASDLQVGDAAKPYLNSLSVVPEPSTLALIGLGLAVVGFRSLRARRKM